MLKTLKRIVIAVLVAVGIFIVLFRNLQASQEKIVYTDVVVAKAEIEADAKISKEDIEIKQVPEDLAISGSLVRSIEEIQDKYAKDKLYPGEPIRTENVKAYVEQEYADPELREIRIITNIASYGGVGKGDRVDIIYVGKIGPVEVVGKMLYQGLTVKKVLNKAGVDIEKVTADKYNLVDLEPSYIDFDVSQEMAMELQTLQGATNDVVFRFVKWTDKSKETETLPEIKTKESVILGVDTLHPADQSLSIPDLPGRSKEGQ